MQPTAPPPCDSAAALKLLLELCALDSGSGGEAALLPALVPALERRGAQIRIQELGPGRCNILATWGEPRVLFSTHLDTVPPYLAPTWDGSMVRGRGACDAKGQIVAQLLALDQLRDQGHSGLAWLGLAGEETDSLGARAILDWRDRFSACAAIINGEPTDLLLASGQRGVDNLQLRCHGQAAHGGSPELGRNAILDLLGWLNRIATIPLAEDPDLGPEVWNLGTIAGGQALNIVPDLASAGLNLRTVPGSRFRAALAGLAPAGAELELLLSEPPCRFPALPGFARGPVPFGSDAPQLQALAPTASLVLAGPGSIRCAHTDQERLSLTELMAGIDLNRRLGQHFLPPLP